MADRNEIETTHKLDFGCAPWGPSITAFQVGTCHGQYGCDKQGYFILTIINDQPGNGHLDDVFEWFEHSAKRDGKPLRVIEIMNDRFYRHLIIKRNFQHFGIDSVIKHFTINK